MEYSFTKSYISEYTSSQELIRKQLHFICRASDEGVRIVDALMHHIEKRCEQVASSSDWNDIIQSRIQMAYTEIKRDQKIRDSSVEYNDWFQARWEIIEELTRNINDDEIAEDALKAMLEFLIELQDEEYCIEDQILKGGVENFVRFLNNTNEYCLQKKIYQKHRALIHASVALLRFMYEGREEKNIQSALKQIEDIC